MISAIRLADVPQLPGPVEEEKKIKKHARDKLHFCVNLFEYETAINV